MKIFYVLFVSFNFNLILLCVGVCQQLNLKGLSYNCCSIIVGKVWGGGGSGGAVHAKRREGGAKL